MIEAALRAASVPPFHAMAMARAALRREAAGKKVFHLHVGQPATGPPTPLAGAVRLHALNCVYRD